jgi:hypothetical protein
LIYGKYGRNVKESTSGGSVVGGEKVWSLAFGDDLVIVAKSDGEIKEMKKNLGKYVRKKKLEVNAEKTKMMEKKVMGCLQGIGERKWGESARKIFERDARSGQRNAKLPNEERM